MIRNPGMRNRYSTGSTVMSTCKYVQAITGWLHRCEYVFLYYVPIVLNTEDDAFSCIIVNFKLSSSA